jgi:hypothetical protein
MTERLRAEKQRDEARASLARAEAERDARPAISADDLAFVPLNFTAPINEAANRVWDALRAHAARSARVSDGGEVCPSCPIKVGTCPECQGTGRAKGGDRG